MAAIIPATALKVLGVYNVKDYGAKGDSRAVSDAVLNGTTTVTSATAAFTSADVGKVVYGIEQATGLVRVPVGTITARNSATSITVSVAATGSYTGIYLVFGTDDSDAIRAAFTAAAAASPRGTVYVPRGGYMFSKLLFDNRYGSLQDGVSVRGDGMTQTRFFIHPSYDLATTAAGQGLLTAISNCQHISFEDFSLDGCGVTLAATGYYGFVFGGFGNSWVRNVYVTHVVGVTYGCFSDSMNRGHVIGLKADFNSGANLRLTGVGADIFDVFLSNGPGRALSIGAVTGDSDLGNRVRFYGGLIDEHSAESVQVTGSTDVEFFGTKIWGGVGLRAMNVISTSTVRLFGCELTQYSSHAGVTGLTVDGTSTAYLSGCRLKGTTTGYALNNSGTVYDLGGNTFVGGFSGAAPLQLGSFRSVAVSPTQLTADVNDYSPGSLAEIVRLTSDASRTITGLKPLALTPTAGQTVQIVNVGSNAIVLAHESASSVAANRLHSTTGADLTLSADQEALCRYDATTSRWRCSKRA